MLCRLINAQLHILGSWDEKCNVCIYFQNCIWLSCWKRHHLDHCQRGERRVLRGQRKSELSISCAAPKPCSSRACSMLIARPEYLQNTCCLYPGLILAKYDSGNKLWQMLFKHSGPSVDVSSCMRDEFGLLSHFNECMSVCISCV